MIRQIRQPTGVPRGNRPQPPLQLDANGDVIMLDAPALPNTYADRISEFYTNNLAPTIDPAINLVANGLRRGVKRAADTLCTTRDRVFQEYVETRRSTEDGLSIKRFKRLPIDPHMASSRAQLTNTLPVDFLKGLPKDQFCWTHDVLEHLGANNHKLVLEFVKEFIDGITADNFIRFPDVHQVIDPRKLPESVAASLKTSGRSEKVSIVLHNHMMVHHKMNNLALFIESGHKLIEKFINFQLCHRHTYGPNGRLSKMKQLGLRPYGPIRYPYTKLNADPHVERFHLLGHIKFLQFMLSQRDAFNQMCPIDTLAGIVADIDAIRKDEPPPSYVDWPGKHQRVPGAFPEDEVDELLFETVPMRDYKPDRMWDMWHPSPHKKITQADYDTPRRNAMKKNEIFYDSDGHAQATKAALRKEDAAPTHPKNARFIDGPVAFYFPSQQEPVKDKKPESRKMRECREMYERMMADRAAAKATQPKPALLSPKQPPRKYRDIDDFFAKEDEGQGLWGSCGVLKISKEKSDEMAVRKQLIEDAAFRSQQEAEAEKRRKEEEERKKTEELRRIEDLRLKEAEEEHRRAQEELRIAEENRVREEDERSAQTGQLRQPHRPLIPAVSAEWVDKVTATLRARHSVELAKTPEGSDLKRKDFETVVPENQWLNDEIVNGALLHVRNYVNQKVGIKNTRLQTPKCQVFNSFVGKNLVEGKPMTERALRKNGIRKDNFLDVETVLIPICRGSHWTLIVVRPKHREIFHLDSLNRNGDSSLKNKAREWVRGILGGGFVESDWTFKTVASPHQSNSDDCGVHTITNGMCIGLGVDPSAYASVEIPLQRLRVAAVLLNEGFEGEFSLDGI